MQYSNLSFEVECHGGSLHLQAKLDNIIIIDKDIISHERIKHCFSDDTVGPHVLEFELSGKLSEHTTVLDDKIVQDRLLAIKNIVIDNVAVDQLVYEQATYTHDFNGAEEPVAHKFYGQIGCNGTVRFEFTSPTYIWLLENM